jgi:uncharacterized protein (DUF1330 family)
MESDMTPLLLSLALMQSVPLAPPPAPLPPLPDSNAPPPSEDLCDEPVLMVVAGPTHDRARMLAYGEAIARSGLYHQLGGYYVNVPRALATFEGDAPQGYTTLIVRFPCLANAQAFWNSRVYQQDILPLRLNPSAGTYTVTVYPEAPVREDMVGQVGDNGYRASFDASTVPQAPPR